MAAADGAPELDVVVVSYRCEPLLRECLRSLLDNAPAAPMRVHVIDNASGDGSVEMVRREFPSVELAESSRNLGFGAANNIGIVAGKAPYVLVLNPDTRLTPGALDALLALLDAQPDVGMVGPRLERDDGSFDHASRRSFPTPLGALGHFSGIGRHAGAPGALSQYRAPEVESGPVDAINGAFMLIRRAALDQVGAFDERYWMYMEDLDLCYRFAESGWRVWFEPTVTVGHVKAGSSGRHRSLRLTYAFHYGMFRFYRDHYASSRNSLLNLAVYAAIAGKFALSAARSAVARAAARRSATGR